MRRSLCLAALAAAALWPSAAFAAGFQIDTHDAKGTGRGFANVAGTDDASALYFNPAAISFIDKSSLRGGFQIIAAQIDYDAQPGSGGYSEQFRRGFFVPNLFASFDTGDMVDVGFGFFSPFNLATSWPRGWPGRYDTLRSAVTFMFFQPTVSIKDPFDLGFSVALGAELVTTQDSIAPESVRLTKAMDWRFLGQPDGEVEITGNSSHLNVGYVLSAYLRPAILDDRVTVGLTWRQTPEPHEIVGEAKFTNIPVGVSLPPKADASTRLLLPPWLQFGVQVEVLEDLLWVEVDYKWTGWSTVKDLRISIRGVDEQVTRFDWRDTNMFMVAIEAKPVKMLSLRAGYFYDQTPVPDGTLSATLPDANRNGVSFGVGLDFGVVRVDVSYMHLFFDAAHKNNGVGSEFGLTANGKYDTLVDIFGISGEVRF